LIFFFCCCCPSCCCNPKGCCCTGDFCPNFSYVLSTLCFIAVIACCIAGFVYSAYILFKNKYKYKYNKLFLLKFFILKIFSGFLNSTNSVTCRFFTFVYNTESGQNITSTPRWIGISNIKKTLQNTITALDEISQNSNKAFADSNWTKTEPENFKKNLTNSYVLFSSRSIPNTNPANSLRKVATITPLYISNLGDYQKSGTLLNSIYQEFDTKISVSITLIEQAKTYSNEITKYSQPIKDSLNSVISQFTPLETAFGNINTNFISPWSDLVN
jgi:hypothetical protein